MSFLDGLLRGVQRGVNDGYFAAAQASAHGNPGMAYGILATAQDEKRKRATAGQAAAAAYDYLVNVAKMDPRTAAAMANDPSVVANFARDANAPQKFDSGGGSIRNPIDGSIFTAPRFDGDGNIYAPSMTRGGQPFQAPQRVQQGTKAIAIPADGELRIVDSVNGLRPSLGGKAAPPQQAGGFAPSERERILQEQAQEAIDNGADPKQVMQRLLQMMGGGAGSAAAPRPFQRSY